MIKKKDKVNLHIKTEIYMMENGMMMKKMGKKNINTIMKIYIKGFGLRLKTRKRNINL